MPSLTQLAEETGYERSCLNRLENGYRVSRVSVMADLDDYYGTGDLARELLSQARTTPNVEEQVAARLGSPPGRTTT